MDEMGNAIEEAVEQIKAAGQREFVGTAADGLVTATLAPGRLDVDLHPLAKRRLERQDLEAAIVEAVNAAEQQAADIPLVTNLESRARTETTDTFYTAFNDAIGQMRARLP